MATIKVNVRHDEYNKVNYFRTFMIKDADEIPDGKRELAYTDISQGSADFGLYDYIIVTDDDDNKEYIATPKERKLDWNLEFYPSNVEVFASQPDIITGDLEHIHFTVDMDGMFFDDEDDLEDFVRERIIDKIDECFGYPDEQKEEITKHFSIHYNYRVDVEEEDEELL